MSLARYVRELVARLGDGEPAALDRMRTVVGTRRAWIELDDEAVRVWFDDVGDLTVEVAGGAAVDGVVSDAEGFGRTRHQVVLALLAGTLDATDAVMDGEIEVRGTPEAVVMMFVAIEILIDCATRVPALRALSQQYVAERSTGQDPDPAPRGRRTVWPPQLRDQSELDLLWGLGLDVR